MARAVVTIHAVHQADLALLELLRRDGRLRRGELRDPALGVLHPDPGNRQAPVVGRDVPDPVGDVHVPVNAFGQAFLRSAPDLHQELDFPAGVLFIRREVDPGGQPLPPELGGPVALLARVLGGPQVADRRRDGAGELVEEDRVDLVRTRELGPHEPLGPRPDVAGDAGDPGVGRVHVRGKHGLHHRVADLSAEFHRIGELVGVVPPDAGQAEEGDHQAETPQGDPRQQQVGEDPDVGVLAGGQEIHQEQEEVRGEAEAGDSGPEQARGIAEARADRNGHA